MPCHQLGPAAWHFWMCPSLSIGWQSRHHHCPTFARRRSWLRRL